MNANEVFRLQDAVLVLVIRHSHQYSSSQVVRPCRIAYLASCVDDLRCKVLPFVSYNLGECVLDSGIVALDKTTVYELYGYRGFPWDVTLVLATCGG
jgi:hypothetical protein